MDVFGDAGESGITFENLSDHTNSSPSEEFVDPDEANVPEIDLDKQKDAGSKIANEKTSEKKNVEPKSKSESKSGDNELSDEEKDEIEAFLEFGEQKFDLKRLMEDARERERFQKTIQDGALMRSDYSKKTAAHADAVRAWENQTRAKEQEFSNYLQETNRVFNGSPLAFVKQAFSRDTNGQLLPPEVTESKMRSWIDKLTEQLERGSDYDPEADLKQYELEKRLNNIEREKQMEEYRRLEARRHRETAELSDHLVRSVLNSMPKDEVFRAFVDSMPGLREKMVEDVISRVDKARSEQYNEGDPTWDDRRFIDTYNFENEWNKPLETFMGAHEKSYESYIQKKKAAGQRKPSKGSQRREVSGDGDDRWTFARMFANG